MKFSLSTIIALASVAGAAYVPSEAWSTLTPTATFPGGVTDYASTFGISVETIGSSTSSSASVTAAAKLLKRGDVSQIGDGQVQAATATSTSTKKSKSSAVTKTKTVSKAVVASQIGDGQVQATATKPSTTSISTETGATQISDGQVQAKKTKTTGSASATTSGSSVKTTSTDDESSTGSSATTTAFSSSSASNTTSTSTTESETAESSVVPSVACYNTGDLAMTLKDSILRDAKGRIGSIVANQQFQFDGPPPQAGAIYAAGWSVTPDGNLAIGDNDVFWQCLSGDFYNLYDENIGSLCYRAHLKIIDLTNC